MNWRTVLVEPKVGQKLVAIYDDGSGAELLYRTDDGYLDSYGDDHHDLDSFAIWAPMPANFKFWCEIRGEDTFTFPPAPDTMEADNG